MKKILLLLTLGLFVSCSNVEHPDYAANVETTKQWIEAVSYTHLTLPTTD